MMNVRDTKVTVIIIILYIYINSVFVQEVQDIDVIAWMVWTSEVSPGEMKL